MPKELLDTIRKDGFNRGYHRCVIDTIELIAIRLHESTGISVGTRNILESLVSEIRVLAVRNLDMENKIG